MRRGALTALGLALLAACGPAGPARGDAAEPRHLLLITIDTLRADALGFYGYARPTSPRLDRFAERSVVLERAYASASWTLPSVVTMMTSLLPGAHGCQGDWSKLAPSYETLAERLGAAGFRTHAVTSHVYLGRRRGLDQGFASFDDELVKKNMEASHLQVSSERVTDKGLEWLRSHGGEPRWFLWLHYFDPHYHYHAHDDPGPSSGPSFGPTDRDRYDDEVRFTDAHLGRLLEALGPLGLDQDTLVVIVADHGEEFGDHGGEGHRATLYEEVLRVPLVVSAPGLAPRRVAEPVSLVDLAPTLLELLDVAPPAVRQGTSFADLLRGERRAPRPVFAELRKRGENDWDALVEGRWKLVRDRTRARTMLYDLESDPAEQQDLAGLHPERVARLVAALDAQLEQSAATAAVFGGAGELELSADELRQLRELGYLGD